MDDLPLPVIVILILAAIALGLWVGGRAGAYKPAEKDRGKTLGARFRSWASGGAVRAWKWNRQRKKRRASENENES